MALDRIKLAKEFEELPATALATQEQTAAWLQISEAKLERDRWAGKGISFVKLGRQVRYTKAEVLKYLAAHSSAA